MKDPIVEKVRQIRKKIEADHGSDWDTLTRHLIAKEKDSSAKVVSYAPKPLPDRGVA